MLALVPARGGSKGLPGKNIRPLDGRPLIAHTIQAALDAESVTRVVCSTDNAQIAAVAREAGAEVPFLRPAELATDTALAIDNYVYTADRLAREWGGPVDEMLVLLPTAPLRTAADIDEAVRMFREREADSVVSYFPAPHPLAWYRTVDDDGVIRNPFGSAELPENRQGEQPMYLPNGAIYVFRMEILRKDRVYYTDRSYAYLMPEIRSVDIDTLADFEYAEFLMGRAATDARGEAS